MLVRLEEVGIMGADHEAMHQRCVWEENGEDFGRSGVVFLKKQQTIKLINHESFCSKQHIHHARCTLLCC